MNKEWKLCQVDEKKVKKIAEEFKINTIVAKIILNKGIEKSEEIETFLHPDRHDFYDPFLMPDMKRAVERIIQAINKGEKTIIYGDYDVDGITSSTVLKKYLEERGLCVDIYIPNRLDEGYGLNENAIKEISSKKYTLIITVDCGITGIKEIALAHKLGIDVIVTDHHEPLEEIPKAVAVIDAKRIDSKYPFNGLAGVGVAFKTIQAISKTLKLKEETYLKYLDLVCIGTISDIVPLKDENRVIAKLGLKLVQKTHNIGIKTLLKNIGYENVDSNSISFGIAPRINACGRMGNEQIALKLLLTDDKKEAEELVQSMNQYNQERQDIEKKIFYESVELTEKTQDPFIIIGKEEWHHGVIGIVSSKITQMYAKPSILLSYEGDMAKGSGRSIKGFDLHEALEKCDTYIEQFGGHSMAVGLTLKKENVSKFKQQIEEYAKEKDINSIVQIIEIDDKINIKDISIQDAEQLELLEPFGEGNRVPLFQINNLKIISIRTLSENKHLKLTVKDDEDNIIDIIGFNLGNLSQEYNIENKIDVIGNIGINNYKGIKTIQLILKDIRHAV